MYLDTDEILELWEVYGVYSTYLNPPSTVEAKILEIENDIREIKKKLKLAGRAILSLFGRIIEMELKALPEIFYACEVLPIFKPF